MALAIPRFIGINIRTVDPSDTIRSSAPRCVQYLAQDGPRNGFIKIGDFNDDGVLSPFAKFEVEGANIHEPELVHLRCTYNNKYLRKASEDATDGSIAAAANSPELDRSKWCCTLFRLRVTGTSIDISTNNYQFRLLYSGQERPIRDRLVGGDMLFEVNTINQQIGTYWLVDLDRLAPLPRFVAFKGDNGRYLRVVMHTNNRRYVTFTGTRANDDVAAQFEVITRRDGTVLLRSLLFRDRDTFLVADRTQQNVFTTSDVANQRINGLIEPHRLGADVGGAYIPVAFWHSEVRSYCGRSDLVLPNSLHGATGGSIGVQNEIQVEELIRNREMFNVQFMFKDSRVYDPSPVAIVSKDIVNRSPVSTQGGELSFSYTEFESSAWNTTHSWQLGLAYTSTISARLPVLRFISAEATVSLEAGYQGEHTVGKVEETTTKLNSKFAVSVAPMTRSKVNMVVSRAKVHVPYSYVQRDTLLDWSVTTTRKFDGLYEGETTHVDFEVEEENLT